MDFIELNKWYDLLHIEICVLDYAGALQHYVPEAGQYECVLQGAPALAEELALASKEYGDVPCLYMETLEIYYGLIPADDGVVVMGPVSRETITAQKLQEYRREHRILHPVSPIPKAGLETMSRILSLAAYEMCGADLEPQDINLIGRGMPRISWRSEAEMEEYQLVQSEENRSHNSMEYEHRMQQIVRSGDVDGAKMLLSGEQVLDQDQVGQVARNENKKMEYLMVAMITMISRAAIEGGMNPEKALQLSDVYMQKIENSCSVGEMQMLSAGLLCEYAEQVRRAQKEKSRVIYVEECKDYIAKNLRKPFKVGDIAPAIGVNRSYLTKRFTEVEGMTIQEYIMKERCAHAANLLKFSDYTISMIAEYLCFSSQSHFGRQFRKYYGMTPNEYRIQNRNIGGSTGN